MNPAMSENYTTKIYICRHESRKLFVCGLVPLSRMFGLYHWVQESLNTNDNPLTFARKSANDCE